MNDLERAMDELLRDHPERTFREVTTELLGDGALQYAQLEDPYVHVWLHKRYVDSRNWANRGRLNAHL